MDITTQVTILEIIRFITIGMIWAYIPFTAHMIIMVDITEDIGEPAGI